MDTQSSYGGTTTEWKARRKLYYICYPEQDDDISKLDIEPILLTDNRDIYLHASHYFTQPQKEIYLPSKSFSVAVIYANLLAEYFGGYPMTYLMDEELLDKDPNWVPYKDAATIYDILMVDYNHRDENLPNMKATKDYFLKEFLIGVDFTTYTIM